MVGGCGGGFPTEEMTFSRLRLTEEMTEAALDLPDRGDDRGDDRGHDLSVAKSAEGSLEPVAAALSTSSFTSMVTHMWSGTMRS